MLFGGFAFFKNVHPYISISAVLTAYSPLLTPLPSTSPSPRLLILWLSQRHLLLGESHPVLHTVDTCSSEFLHLRANTRLLRSQSSFGAQLRTPLFAGFMR